MQRDETQKVMEKRKRNVYSWNEYKSYKSRWNFRPTFVELTREIPRYLSRSDARIANGMGYWDRRSARRTAGAKFESQTEETLMSLIRSRRQPLFKPRFTKF